MANTYPGVIPMLAYQEGVAALDWLVRAFGFTERHRSLGPDGRLAHGELDTGEGLIMLATPTPDYEGPKAHRAHCEGRASGPPCHGLWTASWCTSPTSRSITSGHGLPARPLLRHPSRGLRAGATAPKTSKGTGGCLWSGARTKASRRARPFEGARNRGLGQLLALQPRLLGRAGGAECSNGRRQVSFLCRDSAHLRFRLQAKVATH
jgi:hypothetical protein